MAELRRIDERYSAIGERAAPIPEVSGGPDEPATSTIAAPATTPITTHRSAGAASYLYVILGTDSACTRGRGVACQHVAAGGQA